MSSRKDAIKKLVSRFSRKSERLSLALTISYAVSPCRSWKGPLTIDNISGGGLKFKSPIKLRENTKLKFRIDVLNQSKPITTYGKIIWCKKESSAKKSKAPSYLVGVKLLTMKADDRRAFVSFLCEELLFNYLTDGGTIKE